MKNLKTFTEFYQYVEDQINTLDLYTETLLRQLKLQEDTIGYGSIEHFETKINYGRQTIIDRIRKIETEYVGLFEQVKNVDINVYLCVVPFKIVMDCFQVRFTRKVFIKCPRMSFFPLPFALIIGEPNTDFDEIDNFWQYINEEFDQSPSWIVETKYNREIVKNRELFDSGTTEIKHGPYTKIELAKAEHLNCSVNENEVQYVSLREKKLQMPPEIRLSGTYKSCKGKLDTFLKKISLEYSESIATIIIDVENITTSCLNYLVTINNHYNFHVIIDSCRMPWEIQQQILKKKRKVYALTVCLHKCLTMNRSVTINYRCGLILRNFVTRTYNNIEEVYIDTELNDLSNLHERFPNLRVLIIQDTSHSISSFSCSFMKKIVFPVR